MIGSDHTLSVTRQTALLGISRGSVYYLPRPVSDADLALMRRIDELHREHHSWCARMLRRQFRQIGVPVDDVTSARSCGAWESKRGHRSWAPVTRAG